MPNAIEIQGLSRTFRGNVVAVREMNFVVPSGCVFGLCGPTGAGRSTLLGMLHGTIRPTTGTATLLGRPMGDKRLRREAGFLTAGFAVPPRLTVSAYLHRCGKQAGMETAARESRIAELLAEMGLTDSANVRLHELSRGMRGRVGLAQAVLQRPRLLILEEPFAALDPHGRQIVRGLLNETRSAGGTVLLSSNLLMELEAVCDRVAILKNGQIAAQGTLSELLPLQTTVEIEVHNLNDAALNAIRTIAAKLKLGRMPLTKFTAYVREAGDISLLARAIVENGAELIALVPKRETLEEYFVRVTESA